jgi:general secretion pathway protein H
LARKQPQSTGFTLVEMMVVLVIIGLASAAVVLAIPDPRGRVTDEAERLAARAAAVRDDAIVQGRAMSVVIDASGYRVERRTQGRWQVAGDRIFTPVAWQPGTTVTVGADDRIRATFDSTGAAEPVALLLSRDGAATRVTVGGDGTVRVGN